MKSLFQLPFRRQLTVILLLLSLLIALFTSVFSYQLAYRQFRDMSVQLTKNSIRTVHKAVDDYVSTVHDCTTDILSSSSLRALANMTPVEATIRDDAYWSVIASEVRSNVVMANSANVHFSQIEFYLFNGCSYSTNWEPLFENYQSCLEAMAAGGAEVSTGYVGTQWHVKLFPESTGNELVCIRYIYNSLMEQVGVALFSVKVHPLDNLFRTLSDVQIINKNGTILASQDSTLVGTQMNNQFLFDAIAENSGSNTITYHENGEEKLLSYAPVSGASVYLVVPNTAYAKMLAEKTTQYQKSVIRITSISVLCAGLIAAVISTNMDRKLKKLLDFIRQVDVNHDVQLRYPVEGNSEYDQLGMKINDMLNAIQAATAQQEEDLQVTQTLELSLLRAQLNPHLLYNTLNSVLWNLENHQDGNASQLIGSLSGYFQYALSKGNQIIPLADELTLIQHYLDLQRMARHKNFTLVLDVPAQFMTHKLPKLTLQPIVENAILHGFDGYRDDGVITVTATAQQDRLVLRVSDNGFGIMPDELEQLNASLHARVRPADLHSFGLYGINRTLQQNYGPEYGLEISSEVDSYTCVTVTLPLEQA